VALSGLTLSGCAGSSAAPASSGSPAPATASAGRPVTVMSCKEKLTFTQPPRKVLILNDTDASVLAGLGVLDKVTARAGNLDLDGYDADTAAKLKALPQLKSVTGATGGATVSTETILQAHVDLVVGYDGGVDRAALSKAGVKLYSPNAYCDDVPPVAHADFGIMTKEITKVGDIFGVQDRAKTLNASLTTQVAEVKAHAAGKGATAGAFWVAADGSALYAYGRSSMVQAVFDANDLKNAYEGSEKRVFDATMEDVLKRNPDWIVLLRSDGNATDVKATFEKLKGASQLKAVKSGHVVVVPFSLIDPGTPLSVKGAQELSTLIAK
jgi:iron complex transport system substrate-binding protein